MGVRWLGSFMVCLLVANCSYLSLKLGREGDSFADNLQKTLGRSTFNREAALDRLLEGKDLPVCENGKCYFFYQSESECDVSVAGDWNNWNPQKDQMKSVRGTGYYMLVKEFPSDARFDYRIVENGVSLIDPSNPRQSEGASGVNSELAMPQFCEPEELKPHPDIETSMVEEMAFDSKILQGRRKITVYMPPRYGRQYGPHPFMIVLDGSNYLKLARLPDVADYLIAEKKIRRVVLVCVDSTNHEDDFSENEEFSRFIAEELIPYMYAHYDLSKKHEDCGVMGSGKGGAAAFQLLWRYPNLIGKMAGQSVAFKDNDPLFDAAATSTTDNIQISLDVGRFETFKPDNLLKQNRRMSKILQDRGFSLTYKEYNEGHSWGNWRAHLDDILIAFWPRRAV